jgi:acetate kinase
LISMPSEIELAGGEAQRVGPKTKEPSRIIHRLPEGEETFYCEMPDHASASHEIMKILSLTPELLPHAIGHRMVHGGKLFSDHTLVKKKVLSDLESIKDLAPLHNPPATDLLRICFERYPDLAQCVVFDTAYHSTIPDYARTYALPQNLREELGICKYGFHGTSHQYVAQEAAKFLSRPLKELNMVSCHLGTGGASLCAIKHGCSVDNTMGYSPLQGLIMSTRCGDLDPSVTLKLLAESNGNHQAVEKILNKRSGVLGMSGVSADISDILLELSKDNFDESRLDMTAQIYLWRIRKYLGAYLAVVETADAIIFTDTIGETLPQVRWAACTNMESFGLIINKDKNLSVTEFPVDIATDDSPTRILVIKTNEELAIARTTYFLSHQAA